MNNLHINQLKIIENFINGKNIFMSGPAGTGKTHVIKIIKEFCHKHKKNFQVTALTGCAALLLDCNAKTIHSWSGIGVANDTDINYYIRKIKKNKKYINWKSIDVLIIDEISMMSKKIFNLLDKIGKILRTNDRPFGGIQLIFSGDFFQLPPVSKDISEDSQFCFESDEWENTFPQIHILTKIFRQDNKIFTKILNNIRVGKITKSTIEILKNRIIPYENNNNIIPTTILPHRTTVEAINIREHKLLPDNISKIFGITINYPSQVTIQNYGLTKLEIKREVDFIKNNNLDIEIKIGDQVICTKNITDDIVNGSRGVVIAFNIFPIVKFLSGIQMEMTPIDYIDENIKGLYYKKIPLDYAWALTIHKCQGMTLDLCIMDIGKKIFANGQTYVALSRVKSIEGLYLIDFNYKKIKTSGKVKRFYEKYSQTLETKEKMISEKKRIIDFINTQ
jgi:ATP-dependent DNA helicase PIF1